MPSKEVENILKKYEKELEEISAVPESFEAGSISQEFIQFKKDMMPQFSRYERLCATIGNLVTLKLSAKDEQRISKQIASARIDVTAGQTVFLAIFFAFLVFFAGLLTTVAIYLITGFFSVLMIFMAGITAGFLFYYFYTMPSRLANQWRLKAGSQFVPCILYTVVYMKHTSNLERAVRFASQHLEPPLSLDLKKIFWDVEMGKYSSIKESLDSYLETWRTTSSEFVESFNLIESSLYEPSDARRIQILERALQVILDGVYDRMLKYTHSVKSPLTNLYMLGIVLPTLGLALLPLASALVAGALKWYVVLIFFNVIIPFFVFYMTNEIMIKRPGGYGESSILELNPDYYKYVSKKPYLIAALICLPLLLIGTLPYWMHYTGLPDLLSMKEDYTFAEVGIEFLGNIKMFDYVEGVGPMGPLSLICSLFIPLSIFMFFSISYRMRTKELIEARDKSKILEGEFTNSLFQLGNRIGDGLPAEIAFGRVAESSRGLVTEDFFKIVNDNIRSLGMSLEKAIFDKRRGAMIFYPSNLISTSMHILIESVKKGLKVAAQSLMSIADYIKNINKINERLRDLLAEVVSDMRSNMTFLAPLLAGIVVGLGAMITLILTKLASVVDQATAGAGETVTAGLGNIANIVSIFDVKAMIPPYFLQIIVGVYIIQIVFILTKTLVTVDAGEDKLKVTYDTAANLRSAGFLYLGVAIVAILALSALAAIALVNLTI